MRGRFDILLAVAVILGAIVIARTESENTELRRQVAELQQDVTVLADEKAQTEIELAMAREEYLALRAELDMALEMLEDPMSLFGGTIREMTPQEEKEVMGIAMAEARGQGLIGKMLVMNTIFNRVDRDGKSIHDVIYAPNQYYTAGMSKPDEECEIALLMVAAGWDGSQGALYFCNSGYNGPTPLFKYRDHWFSK